MNLNHKYKVAVDALDRILTYTVTILEIEDFFFKVKDRDNKVMFIAKDRIIYFEEVGE